MSDVFSGAASSAEPSGKRFWVSWYADHGNGPYTVHSPWWVSGYEVRFDEEGESDDIATICAAVIAQNEDDAMEVIRRAHDVPPIGMRWRFVEQRPDNWAPFCDRFPRAEWMAWPAQTSNETEK